jgi:hypothetical protein
VEAHVAPQEHCIFKNTVFSRILYFQEYCILYSGTQRGYLASALLMLACRDWEAKVGLLHLPLGVSLCVSVSESEVAVQVVVLPTAGKVSDTSPMRAGFVRQYQYLCHNVILKPHSDCSTKTRTHIVFWCVHAATMLPRSYNRISTSSTDEVVHFLCSCGRGEHEIVLSVALWRAAGFQQIVQGYRCHEV